MKTLKIKLPIMKNDDGSDYIDSSKQYSEDGYVPNWDYMANYMEEVEEKAQSRIDLLNKIANI